MKTIAMLLCYGLIIAANWFNNASLLQHVIVLAVAVAVGFIAYHAGYEGRKNEKGLWIHEQRN